MELLSQIIIPRSEGNASIQLLFGDLTDIPPQFAVDILAISAFRGDYKFFPGTLMAALHNTGLLVSELAKDKEVDLTGQLSCWLSRPLSSAQQVRFNVKKILCFEPLPGLNDVETEVSKLFRGINTFAIDDQHNDIAMPVLATGTQGLSISAMLPVLLDTALFWLESGLPLKSLKLVLHRSEQLAVGLPIFENVRKQYELKVLAEGGEISAKKALMDIDVLTRATTITHNFSLPKMEFTLQEMNRVETNKQGSVQELTQGLDELLPPVGSPKQYDYFISYSHKYTAATQELVRALQAQNPLFSIFYDRDSIPAGGLWIKLISDAIQNAKNVICILTPEYSQSAVCWDEFQCAYIMQKRQKLMIKTINFCHDDNLPPIMALYSYIDCREGDLEKLKGAVSQLVNA